MYKKIVIEDVRNGESEYITRYSDSNDRVVREDTQLYTTIFEYGDDGKIRGYHVFRKGGKKVIQSTTLNTEDGSDTTCIVNEKFTQYTTYDKYGVILKKIIVRDGVETVVTDNTIERREVTDGVSTRIECKYIPSDENDFIECRIIDPKIDKVVYEEVGYYEANNFYNTDGNLDRKVVHYFDNDFEADDFVEVQETQIFYDVNGRETGRVTRNAENGEILEKSIEFRDMEGRVIYRWYKDELHDEGEEEYFVYEGGRLSHSYDSEGIKTQLYYEEVESAGIEKYLEYISK